MMCGHLLLISHLNQQRRSKKISLRKAFALVISMLLLSQCTVEGPKKVIVLRPNEILAEPGDTVYSLAQKHHVPVRALIESNGLIPPYTLREDQKLVIPQEAHYPPPPAPPVLSGPKLIQPDASVQWTDVAEPKSESSMDERLMEEAQKEPHEALEPSSTKISNKVSSESKLTETPSENKLSAEKKAPLGNLSSEAKPSSKFSAPVRGKIIRGFGQAGGKKSHGLYFEAKSHPTVKASATGTILFVGDELEKGQNIVVIQHDDGWLTAYAPLENISVRKGQKVQASTVLGKAQGPELYFEMRKDRRPVDPTPHLR